MKPLGIDLFCGLGGWTDGLLAEGYEVIGFDIERHEYGEHRYPAQLVVQDVRTLHGSQFKDATLIVASPPCQAYSYRAMPWTRARALPPPDNTLFETCFRIQREACEAAGRHIPLIVENVRGAQKWVGRARWNFGSFYLWGDVPALMPLVLRMPAKRPGHDWSRFKETGEVSPHWRLNGEDSRKVASHLNRRDGRPHIGTKRKFASAMIAKIPLPLARHIAAVYQVNRLLFKPARKPA
jgi:site-specific DNA-cytosine methylase